MSVTLTVAPVQVVLRTSTVVAVDGADGVGIPAGGSAGQVLAKSSGIDYATTWTDPADASDPAGTAAAAILAHEAAGDPHPLYRLEAAAVPWADLSGVVSVTAGTGLTGGGSLTATISLAVSYGTSGTTSCVGNDSRLSDSRTPTAHAASHASIGSDPVTLAEAQVTGLVSDLSARALVTTTISAGTGLSGGGDLSANRSFEVAYGSSSSTSCVGNDARLSDSRAPTGSATGDLTGTYPAPTIAANAVTNAKLATVATATFKGRTTAGTGNAEDLTAAQATALLSAVVGDSGSGGTKGLVPAPAAGDGAAKKVMQADGAWAIPAAVLPVTATFSGTGTHTFDMSLAQQQFHVVTVSASTTVTIAGSNITANKHLSLLIKNTSGGTVTLSWPAFLAMGAALPTTIPTGKALVVALSSVGTTAGEIYATAAAQV